MSARCLLPVGAICLGLLADSAGARQADSGPPAEARPLVVVTHGMQLAGTVPAWAWEIQAILQDRGIPCIVMDWASESNDAAPGWTEAAGDELLAHVLWEATRSDRPLELHLIGHSRGAIVNSEFQKRLERILRACPAISTAFHRVFVTMLDPHPANPEAKVVVREAALAHWVERFHDNACDPAPWIAPNTTQAFVYFQRVQPCGDERQINPWGYIDGLTMRPGDVLTDLTDKFFESCGADGQPHRRQLDHTQLGPWYVETIRSNRCYEVRGDLISGGGYFDYERATRKQPTVEPNLSNRGKTRADAESDVEQFPFVFNGDFRFNGRVKDLMLCLLQEKTRIPGWQSNRPIWVTGQGHLRLATFSGPDGETRVVRLTHSPLFVPAEMQTLEWMLASSRAETGSPDGRLTVYWVPLEVAADGNLQLNHHNRTELASWPLGQLLEPAHLSVALPKGNGRDGTSAAISFELSTSCSVTIEVDDVRLSRGTKSKPPALAAAGRR